MIAVILQSIYDRINCFIVVDDMYYIKYSLQNINGNQSQAESICLRNDNSFLPFSDTLNDYTRIQEYIKEYNVQKSWIGLKKRMYNTPHWINSSVVGLYHNTVLLIQFYMRAILGLHDVNLYLISCYLLKLNIYSQKARQHHQRNNVAISLYIKI